MLFNSSEFFFYFIIVTAIYYILPHKFRWFHLLVASCYFYMAFVPIYILILFGTIVVDYFAGILIENAQTEERKKGFLILSLVVNIGVLAVFKYYNFFIENINAIIHIGNSNFNLPYLKILLPIGLSFHTFQAMAYTIEIYREEQKAERHFGIYALYVMFYPQLVAGPIERPQNILHQFKTKQTFTVQQFFSGIRLMLWGTFKKVVVADRLSIYVDSIYANPEQYGNYINIFIAFFFFSMQVYCDFSGYSDIAVGSAKTMGFDLMQNFNRPFFSKSISEFWRKWHISLTTWFTDYLFTPIAANKRHWGKWGIIFALFITFFMSGLWHGAAWTFVTFGVLNSIALVYEILTKEFRLKLSQKIPTFIYNPLSMLLTFSFIVFCTIFFRSPTFNEAFFLIKNAMTLNSSVPYQTVVAINKIEFGLSSFIISFFLIAFTMLVELKTTPNLYEFNSKKTWDIIFCTTLIILIISLGVFQRNSFIYFQF